MLDAERYRRTEFLNGLTIQVQLWEHDKAATWWIWKLIPVKAEGMPTPSQSSPSSSGSPPTYDGDTPGQSSAHAQYTESERDDFGTVVTEVTTTTNTTTTTTTTTTRKKYRVQDA